MTRLGRNKIIFSDWFRQRQLRIHYLDIGARQDLISPWDLVAPVNLRVIGFEPDGDECARLQRAFPERRYYPTALWSERARRTLHINREPSTSSIYPANEELGRLFDERHFEPRQERAQVEVECRPLDDALEPADLPHYVKIDTQGAEYAILKGAQQTLRRRAMFVSAETWTTEIYRGAAPFHMVAGVLWDLGYQLIDSEIAAAWDHRTSKHRAPLYGRPTVTGLELLFRRRDELLDAASFGSPDDFTIHIAIAELFGFRSYALHLVERFPSILPSSDHAHLLAALLDNSRADRSLVNRFRTLLTILSGNRRGAFAPLR